MSGGDDVMALLSATASGYKGKEDKKDPRRRSDQEKAKKQEEVAAKIKERNTAPSDSCVTCNKIVYLAERREVEIAGKKEIFHKACFRCNDCSIQLELNNFASINRVIYCKVHIRDHKNEMKKQDDSQNDGKVYEANAQVVAKINNFREQGSDSNKCTLCNKSVFLTERIDVEVKGVKQGFHKACFRCSVCGLQLNMRNYGSINSVLYCQPHLKENQPKMAKSENAYFISPLKEETESTESIGALTIDEAKNQESSVAQAKTKKEPEKEPVKEEPTKKIEKVEESEEDREAERRRRRQEREKERERQAAEEEKQREAELAKKREEREKRLKELGGSSSNTSTTSENTEDEEKDRRQREREERRKQREAERKQQEEEEARALEQKRKEREEAKRQIEEAARKEQEELDRKAEERKKRLEALKTS